MRSRQWLPKVYNDLAHHVVRNSHEGSTVSQSLNGRSWIVERVGMTHAEMRMP